MPTLRAAWEPQFGTGLEAIDAQHLGLLTQCNLLADLCDQANVCNCSGAHAEAGARAFDQAYGQLKLLARAHFEAEAALLAGAGYPELEDHQFECDEFDYLAAEIVTADNFSRVELQRFLTLWCVGHISGSARQQSAFLGGASAPA